MDKNEKPTIFQKIVQASEMALDRYVSKARSDIASEEDNAFYRKSIYRDITYSSGVMGYQEKANRLSYDNLQHMSRKNTIIAAIIQTYQNKVAAHAAPTDKQHEKGFKITLKDEDEKLQLMLEKLFPEKYGDKKSAKKSEADPYESGKKMLEETDDVEKDIEESDIPEDLEEETDHNKDKELSEKEMIRMAKKELHKQTRTRVKEIEKMMESCGKKEDRPWESQRWDFDAYLRAIVRDTLTYDQIGTEMIPDNANRPHHWVPVDGGTIRYSTPSLRKYNEMDLQQPGYDLLFPEKELQAMADQRDALVLDDEKLENDDYKYVQVVRGKIIRAFTPDELFIGMRNPTTNLYANGYSVSELEILLAIITSHIFTENYNKSYFTQGFSSKGILHVKAPLNRRKLESLRVQWQHMIKGNKNSFQTPILSGMDEVKWIPLTQNHSDMEFTNWMNYLIKMMCSIYQIDPLEIGFGMKEEGGTGGSLSGDNTSEKFTASKNKGLIPLLKFLERYLNRHVVDKIDPDYKLTFVGVGEETLGETLERQSKEIKFKKSVNEIRAEDGLPPWPGCDELLLDQVYFMWFSQFHPDGKKMQKEMQSNQELQGMTQTMEETANKNEDQIQGISDSTQEDANKEEEAAQAHVQGQEESLQSQDESVNEQVSNVQEELGPKDKKVKKALKVEWYKIGDD